MRPRLLTLASRLFRRCPRPAPSTRLVLEQLEDRCVPSANMMQPMGMPMTNTPPTNMGMMNMQPMSMSMQPMSMNMMTFQQEASAFAALDKMFMNFIAQEVAMIQTIVTDLAQMPNSPMGGMM